MRQTKVRRAVRDRELAQAGEPFTDQEVHALAFGTPDQWAGVIHRERWRAQGAVVMDVWAARVRADREFFDTQVSGSEEGAEAPARPEPWPVAFYGKPDGK
jgi:hypothetical protein